MPIGFPDWELKAVRELDGTKWDIYGKTLSYVAKENLPIFSYPTKLTALLEDKL